MVDPVPIRAEPVVTSEAPQSRISTGEFAQPYTMLGNSLDKLGEGVEAVATPLAERAGAEAVTRGPDGKIQVEHMPIFGLAGKAYARAVKFGALAEADGEAERQDIGLREKYRDNPDGYVKAANSYKQQAVQDMTDAAGPEVGIALGRAIDNKTTLTYRGLQNEKERLDLQRSENSSKARREDFADNLHNLSAAGVTSGPEWEYNWNGYKSVTDELVNNPRLAYPREMADYEVNKLRDGLQIDGVRFHTGEVYDKPGPEGGPEAARKYAESIGTDQSLHFAGTQRHAAVAAALSEVRQRDADRRQTVQDIRADFQDVKDLGGQQRPSQISQLVQRATDARDPILAARISEYGTLSNAVAPFNQSPLPQQDHAINVLSASVASGNAGHTEVELLKELKEQRAATEKGLAEGGASFVASRFPDQAGKLLPVNNPQAFGASVSGRAQVADWAQTVYQGGKIPLFSKTENEQIRTMMQGDGGPGALATASSTLTKDELAALSTEPGFKDGLVGMSRSGDPAKMNSAFTFMDKLQRQDPLAFEKEYPDGLKMLRTWQTQLGYSNPQELAKRMTQLNSVADTVAREATDKAANKVLETVSPEKIVQKFSTGFGPIGTTALPPASLGNAAGAMKADYDMHFRDGVANNMDAAGADAYAMEKLRLKYSLSPTNGDRVTAWAPERYYPPVNGSHDWMAKQLDDAVAKELKVDTSLPQGMEIYARSSPDLLMTGDDTVGERKYQAQRAIVPDDTTERDIAAGKPPRYGVIFRDPNGHWSAMTEPDGTPRRIRFDPTGPFAEHAAQAEQARPTIQALQQPFAGGVTP
jgi:hypothetical protein